MIYDVYTKHGKFRVRADEMIYEIERDLDLIFYHEGHKIAVFRDWDLFVEVPLIYL